MLRALLFFIALVAPSPAGATFPAPPSFDHCEQLAAREPESEATGRCFVETGDDLKQPETRRRRGSRNC